MKILETKDLSNWFHKHYCVNCESVLEVHAQDVRCVTANEYTKSKYLATCPVCEKDFDLYYENLPKLLVAELKDKEKSKKKFWLF